MQVISWAPVTVFKYLNDGAQRLFPHLRAIGLPSVIAVNWDFGWVIADAKTMHKYGIGYANPWPMPRSYFYKTGYLVKGESLIYWRVV